MISKGSNFVITNGSTQLTNEKSLRLWLAVKLTEMVHQEKVRINQPKGLKKIQRSQQLIPLTPQLKPKIRYLI